MVTEAPPPASAGVFPLDVESWVHTTVPQLFRAAVSVVVSNAQTAGPLGVPTLLAFFEPHVCCRRHESGYGGGSRSRVSSISSISVSQAEKEEVNSAAAAAEMNQGKKGNGVDGELGSLLEGETDAAAAAGAAVAEESGVSGDGLMSRMALESVGLLVEGLAGGQQKQVSAAVLAHLCGSLVHMLHCCLPESLDPAERAAHVADGEDNEHEAGAGVRVVLFGGDVVGEGGAAGKASANGSTVAAGGGGSGDGGEHGEDGAGDRCGDGSGGPGGEEESSRRRGKASDLWPGVAAARGGSELTTGDKQKEEETSYPTEEIADGSASGGALLARTESSSLSVSDGDGGGGGGAEFDGVRAAALLAAALRLQRLLYGLARLHLSRLGEDQTRVLMGALSRGLRYARDFQAQRGLRSSLFAAG